jgi:ABC-type multidrug transport system permease subunit
MIATWMLYTLAIGALVGVAGLALERVAAARGVPMRFVWLASMIVSVAWPVANCPGVNTRFGCVAKSVAN